MKRSLVFAGSLLGAATTISYLLFSPSPSTREPDVQTASSAPLSPSPPTINLNTEVDTPVLLRVPPLHIEAPIEEVGLTPEGNMAAPTSNTTLGWYKYGAMPGNPGPAVLAAHTGLPNQPTMFRRLEHIQKGDIVEVKDKKGATVSFEVVEQAIYTPDTAPRERIFGATSAAQLTIITCTGTWLPKERTYSHRLVMYAVRKT